MSKKHNDYEIKIAKEIAEIRRTGLVNMFFLKCNSLYVYI